MKDVKVVVTRAPETGPRLVERLRAEGFDVVERPLVRIEPLPGPPVRTDAYDWVVITSRIGAEHLLRRLDGALPRVAAIGPGTAEALRERGVEPDVVASRSTQEGLLEALPRPPGRVLLAAAEGARDLLARELAADFLPLYRTVEEPEAHVPDADLVVLASASAARALARVRRDLPCASIGPVTSAVARAHGLRVIAEAQSHDLDGLVAAVRGLRRKDGLGRLR